MDEDKGLNQKLSRTRSPHSAQMMPDDLRGIPEEKLEFATNELCFRLVESLVVD